MRGRTQARMLMAVWCLACCFTGFNCCAAEASGYIAARIDCNVATDGAMSCDAERAAASARYSAGVLPGSMAAEMGIWPNSIQSISKDHVNRHFTSLTGAETTRDLPEGVQPNTARSGAELIDGMASGATDAVPVEPFPQPTTATFAQALTGALSETDAARLSDSIAESTGEQLAALDVTGLQSAADALAGAGAFDVRGVLAQLSAGEGLDAQKLLRGALELIAGMLRGRAAFMIALITGAVLAGVAARLCGDNGARVASMASLCVAAVLIAADFAVLARDARAALEAMGTALDALLPLISGALAAMGAGVTSGLLGSALSALAGAGLMYGREYVVGLALMSAALELCAGLNPRARLSALAELMRTASGLMVGAALVVALGAISINGTLGAGMDGVSLRAAKYALDNMVPVVGGEIKDTVEVMAASCLMVQNLLGVCGMLLMVIGMARPVLTLTAAYLSYKACSAAAQALGGVQLGGLCEGIGRVLRTLMIAVLGAAAIAIMLLGALNASARTLFAA